MDEIGNGRQDHNEVVEQEGTNRKYEREKDNKRKSKFTPLCYKPEGRGFDSLN
jgi:hypothetical protein